jgi:hypothetical protein
MMGLLRASAAVLLCTAQLGAAIPRAPQGQRQLRGRAHEAVDVITGEHDSFSPGGVPTAPDGMPECEIYIDGPHKGQENLLDSWQGPGTCDYWIANGRSCEHWFCPECNRNQDCNKACGFCESTADEPGSVVVPVDSSCINDEAARAAADPFKNELSPFTQGCDQIAGNGYCEDQAYIELGVLTFCCESCAAEAEKETVEGVCDFMAVVNGCQDPEAITAMHSGDIRRVCQNVCSVSVMDNWEACLADTSSDFGQFAEQLEPVVTGCRILDNGGVYDAAALIAALGGGQ